MLRQKEKYFFPVLFMGYCGRVLIAVLWLPEHERLLHHKKKKKKIVNLKSLVTSEGVI